MSDFNWGDALRDAGIETASNAQQNYDSTWSTRAYAALIDLARRLETIHIDDFLTAFPERPARPNANGAVWMKARKAGILVPSGQLRKCSSDSGKHSHVYPVYWSTLCR